MRRGKLSSYKEAGVDIEAGEEAVERIKPLVASTNRPGVTGGIGGFGGLFDPAAAGHDGSMLVSATDGVGTKALVATMTGRFDTIGIDLVAMCVSMTSFVRALKRCSFWTTYRLAHLTSIRWKRSSPE